MKNTSRRNFGKQLAGGIAAVSVASIAGKGASLDGSEQRPKTTSQRKIRTHDTPPPLEFDNGSFVVEKERDFNRSDVNGDRLEYKITSGNTTLHHIKIVDGSGEVLFRKNDADACKVSVELRNSQGNANSSTSINAFSRSINNTTKHFIVDVNGDKTLQPPQGNEDKPTSKKRDKRFRHSGGANFSMWKITITEETNTTETVFTLFPRTLAEEGADLKVMMWLE